MSAPPNAPRVFLSSTQYDFAVLRELLEVFLEDMGYQPVLHNRGNVPYGHADTLEDDCLAKVRECEILVNILGKRGGAGSQSGIGTITEQELLCAIRTGVTVYVFVEHSTMAEYRSFVANERSDRFVAATDRRVFELLDRLESPEFAATVPKEQFGTALELWTKLRNQLSGNVTLLLREKNKSRKKRLKSARSRGGANLKPDASEAVQRASANEPHGGRRACGAKNTKPEREPSSIKLVDTIESIRSFYDNVKQVKDFVMGRDPGFGGFWRIEFVRDLPGSGCTCGVEITLNPPRRLRRIEIRATKFESHGWAHAQFEFSQRSHRDPRQIVIFDHEKETDTKISKSLDLGFTEPVSRLRIQFSGNSSRPMWYEIQDLVIS